MVLNTLIHMQLNIVRKQVEKMKDMAFHIDGIVDNSGNKNIK